MSRTRETSGCDRIKLKTHSNCDRSEELLCSSLELALLFRLKYIKKQRGYMPEVTRFYGITIKIFFGDHPPPHFHAIYGDFNALIGITSLEIIEGDLPRRAEKLVMEWATLYQDELLSMWNTQDFCKLPPLK